MTEGALRACLDALDVRGELVPADFTVEDARGLCERVATVYASNLTEDTLRRHVRRLYRQMFELLVGSAPEPDQRLVDVPLAARTADGYGFLPAKDVLYASVPGSRERSGVQGMVPLFVIEAEASALAPLRSAFGMPTLESALNWTASPGPSAFDDDEHFEAFREGLRGLMVPLLARMSADRPERASEDRRGIQAFVEGIQPVADLTLSCSFQGQELGDVPQRNYYVQRGGRELVGYVRWARERAWPPLPEDAQTLAMALAEALEVNTVETFLSFINADENQRRQLLELAGAVERIAEVSAALGTTEPGAGDHGGEQETLHATPEPTEGTSSEPPELAQEHGGARPAPKIPLHKFEDLLIDGQLIRIDGVMTEPGTSGDRSPRRGEPSGGVPRAAAGMDLSGLDWLGMQITFASERHRLAGLTAVVLPADDPPTGAEAFIVDVSNPRVIEAACGQSPVVRDVFELLQDCGISEVHPGFDVLTIVGGKPDRLIELKSSGVDAQVQAMSWNEWKTASGGLRHLFWLYLVGNLRADLRDAPPFVRAVHDPFGALASASVEESTLRRAVQLRVREFAAADELTLQVRGATPVANAY